MVAGAGRCRARRIAIAGGTGGSVTVVDLATRTPVAAADFPVDASSRRLFVSGLALGEVRVFDSFSGAQLATITHPTSGGASVSP
jgi:hypothetical protein